MDELKLRYNRFDEDDLSLTIVYDGSNAERGLTNVATDLDVVADRLEEASERFLNFEHIQQKLIGESPFESIINDLDRMLDKTTRLGELIAKSFNFYKGVQTEFINGEKITITESLGNLYGSAYGNLWFKGEEADAMLSGVKEFDGTLQKVYDKSLSMNKLFTNMPEFLKKMVDEDSDMYDKLKSISDLEFVTDEDATSFLRKSYVLQNKDVGKPMNNGKLPDGNLVLSQRLGQQLFNVPQLNEAGDALERVKEESYALQQNGGIAGFITPDDISMLNSMKAPLEDVKDEMHGVGEETRNTADEFKKSGNSFNDWLTHTASFINRVRTIITAVKDIGRAIMNTYNAYSEYVEGMNLFSVSLGDYAREGYEWATKISDALYLDPTMVLNYTGQIYNLVEGMGIASDVAFKMSKNLSQIAIDMSSYLNIDYEAAYKKVISAISGQSRAIVTAGVPLQAASLGEFAKSIGIEKSISDMTQAEKTLLRYIVLMESTKTVTKEASEDGKEYNAMQMDLGRTLASPSNAMKALNQQVKNLQRSLGYLLAAVIKPMLPYFIAFTRIIENCAYAIAKFFGVDTSAWKLGETNTQVNDLSKALNDMSESGDAAAGSINRTLAAFDDLNVVESESGGKGSGGSGGSILQDLYDYIEGYDILGQLSDELDTQVDKATKNLEKLGNAILGVALAFGAIKIVKTLGNLASWVSNTGSAISNIASWFKGASPNDIKKNASDTKEALNATVDMGDTAASKFGTLKDFKTKAKQITEAIGLLGLVIIELGALVSAIGWLVTKFPNIKVLATEGIDSCVELFAGIVKMLPGLAGLTALATVISKVGKGDMAIGFAELAGVIVASEAIVLAIGGLLAIPGWKDASESGVDGVVKVFEGIGKILIPLAGLEALAWLNGKGASAIIPGLAILGAVVTATAAFVELLGAAVEIWGDTSLIEEGVDALVIIFNGVGKALGAIVGGIGEGISNSLPKIGENLNGFYTNSKDFFDALKTMGPETLNGAANFTKAVAELATDGFISSITTVLTIKAKMEAIGDALNVFAPKMVEYANTLGEISTENLDKTVNLTNSVTEFAKAAPRWGGAKALINGEIDLWKLGCQLAGFGGKMYDYAEHMKGVDLSIVDKSIAAAKSVTEFANLSPKYSWLKQMLGGGVDLWKFGSQLAGFGGKFWDYFNNVRYIDSDVVERSSEAAESIMKFAALSPKYSAIQKIFTGEHNLWEFGKQLAGFGGKFGDYHANIMYIDFNRIEQSVKSLNEIADVAQRIKNNDLGNALGNFAGKLTMAGTGLTNFFSKAKGGELGNTFGTGVADGIEKGIKNHLSTSIKLTSNDGLFGGNKTITTFNVKAYAEGGMPNSGDFFLANENGRAEYIASIGNKTAVANQDQMTNALANTITRALGNINANNQNGDVIVYIGNDKVYQGQGQYQSSETDRYGTTYVRI